MSEITFNYYPQFFTATILEWKYLLAGDKMKVIIISSLQFLVNDRRVKGIWLCHNAKSYSSYLANTGRTSESKSAAKLFEIYGTANEVYVSKD